MNAVEIEEAVSKLVEEPFNAAEFSYAFLEAFGNKTATLQRLRSVGKNSTNKTDLVAKEFMPYFSGTIFTSPHALRVALTLSLVY